MTLWLTIKNMFSRPRRLIVLLLCVTIACIASFAAFDMGGAVRKVIGSYLTEYAGEAELMAGVPDGFTEESFAECPPCKIVLFQIGDKREVKRDERLYTYELCEYAEIYGFKDPDKAYDMKLIYEKFDLADNEVAIGRHYSEKYGYGIGSSITLTDSDLNEFTVTVAKIFEDRGFMAPENLNVIAPVSVTEKMTGSELFNSAMIDTLDTPVSEFENIIKEKLPEAEVNKIATEDIENVVRSLNIVLYLVFALTLLLVVFVTVSFTEKMMVERMSTIGTLRSVGMSRAHTTFLLMLENALYGLFGALIGTAVYLSVRDPLLKSSLTAAAGMSAGELREMIGSVKPAVCTGVIVGAVLLELATPLVYTLRAVKTPIRDIIFSNKDTEYTVSPAKTIAGAVLFAAGLLVLAATDDPNILISAVILLVIGTALFVQFVVKYAAKGLEKLFGRVGAVGAEFACIEAGSKKTDMGNAVLTVTTMIAAAAVFVIGSSMIDWSDRVIYDTDIIVQSYVAQSAEDLDYITDNEAVTDVEFVYEQEDSVRVNGEKKPHEVSVIMFPKGEQYKGIDGLPEALGMNEICMDAMLARKLGVKEGGTFEAEFRSDGMFPIVREMKLVRCVNTLAGSSSGALVLNPDLYHELYGDCPRTLLLRTSGDPQAFADKLGKALSTDERVMTMQEYIGQKNSDSRGTRMALYAVIGVAMALTMIGISGNQMIGFDARRRELALLHSTAMSRGQLIRTLLMENAVSFGISIAIAAAVSIPVTAAISRIFIHVDLGIIIIPQYGRLALFAAVILAVIMLTTLSPARQLLRMNTANEIKYE